MNDLFTASWRRFKLHSFERLERDQKQQGLEGEPVLTPSQEFAVENQKVFHNQMKALELNFEQGNELLVRLKTGHEKTKVLVTESQVKDVRKIMHDDFKLLKTLAKILKKKLEDLSTDNERNRKFPGCEEGTAIDRMRMNITRSLRGRMRTEVDNILHLKDQMVIDNRATVAKSVFRCTGVKPDAREVEILIETGGSEVIFNQVVQRHGERAGTVFDGMKGENEVSLQFLKNTVEVYDLFVDLLTFFDTQGGLLGDDIENQVKIAKDHVSEKTEVLETAKDKQQPKRRKWQLFCGLIVCAMTIVIVLVVTLIIVK